MKTWIATLLACGVLMAGGLAMAGDMTPPAGPDQPTMNTVQEIQDDLQALENRLNTALTRRTGTDFSHPDTDYDDGAILAGVPWPDPRFTDNGDGTVTDNLTGLIWLQCSVDTGIMTREQAMEWASRLEDGQLCLSDGSQKGDWRLPNIKEMISLLSFCFYDQPSLKEPHPFAIPADTGFIYVTSTPYAAAPDGMVWTIDLITGRTWGYWKYDFFRSWPVRGGMYGQ